MSGDEGMMKRIEIGNRLWHQGLSEKLSEKERLERSIEEKMLTLQAEIEVLKEAKR